MRIGRQGGLVMSAFSETRPTDRVSIWLGECVLWLSAALSHQPDALKTASSGPSASDGARCRYGLDHTFPGSIADEHQSTWREWPITTRTPA